MELAEAEEQTLKKTAAVASEVKPSILKHLYKRTRHERGGPDRDSVVQKPEAGESRIPRGSAQVRLMDDDTDATAGETMNQGSITHQSHRSPSVHEVMASQGCYMARKCL
jgi:hypothetical protein